MYLIGKWKSGIRFVADSNMNEVVDESEVFGAEVRDNWEEVIETFLQLNCISSFQCQIILFLHICSNFINYNWHWNTQAAAYICTKVAAVAIESEPHCWILMEIAMSLF